MRFRYTLKKVWIDKVAAMEEFANGATQVSVSTKDDKVYRSVLISNATWIVAMRGYADLPFRIEDIIDIFQTDEDRNPSQRGGWHFWDDWK